MLEILIELAKIVPVIAVLWLVILWLKKNYVKKEEEITHLNDEIRDLNKENLSLLYKVLSFFEKLDDGSQSKHESVLRDIQSLKETIIEKINNLK